MAKISLTCSKEGILELLQMLLHFQAGKQACQEDRRRQMTGMMTSLNLYINRKEMKVKILTGYLKLEERFTLMSLTC